MPVTVDELFVADSPSLWEGLGFRVEGSSCDIGSVRVQFEPDAGKGIAGWSLRGIETTELDGLATEISHASPRAAAGQHPNGVTVIDHVVAFSPELDRTIAALQEAGMELRRIREEPTPAGAPRQAFFHLGELVLEVVQMPDSPDLDRTRNARLWGLALVTYDIHMTTATLAGRIGAVRPAVQDGRRIATLRTEAASVPIAFMTPRPARTSSQSE